MRYNLANIAIRWDDMFRQIIDRWQRKKHARLGEDLRTWHQLCSDVTRICGEALHNEDIGGREIGELLDKTDRMLFRLREPLPSSWPLLRRRAPELARRVPELSDQVYRLRNQTSRFLIRCQGPAPLTARPEGQVRSAYYQQALETFGLEGRRIWRELEEELGVIVEDIQELVADLEP
jgi:hypothetical protein